MKKFKEVRKKPSEDKLTLLKYMVDEIEFNDENTKMDISFNGKEAFEEICKRLERLFTDASLTQTKIQFKASIDKKKSIICFEKNLNSSLNFLNMHKALSNDTYNEIDTYLKKLETSLSPSTTSLG